MENPHFLDGVLMMGLVVESQMFLYGLFKKLGSSIS
jgi:hypothetical protein